jgi:hypothetical protein
MAGPSGPASERLALPRPMQSGHSRLVGMRSGSTLPMIQCSHGSILEHVQTLSHLRDVQRDPDTEGC